MPRRRSRRTWPPGGCARRRSTRSCSPATWTSPGSRTSTFSSGRRGSSGSPTSCSGSPPTRSSSSSTRSFPISTAVTCGTPARSTPAGTAGTAAPSRTRCPLRAPSGPSAPGLPDDDNHHADERDDAPQPCLGVEAGPRQVGEPAQEYADHQKGSRPDQTRHGETRYQQPEQDNQQDPLGQLGQENQGAGA